MKVERGKNKDAIKQHLAVKRIFTKLHFTTFSEAKQNGETNASLSISASAMEFLPDTEHHVLIN